MGSCTGKLSKDNCWQGIQVFAPIKLLVRRRKHRGALEDQVARTSLPQWLMVDPESYIQHTLQEVIIDTNLSNSSKESAGTLL